MANEEKAKRKSGEASVAKEGKAESLWRRPITLDVEGDDDDPLATLYRGREVGGEKMARKLSSQTQKTIAQVAEPIPVKSEVVEELLTEKKETVQERVNNAPETMTEEQEKKETQAETSAPEKITESELKAALKIKTDTYHFTDIREILRGKSIDIYAYLRLLCGDRNVCKIKHLDMMQRLDISRPTLFKQGEWLTKLSLIEKRNVPGDHLGTSYTVRRLEDVLPVSDELVIQLESYIEDLRRTID